MTVKTYESILEEVVDVFIKKQHLENTLKDHDVYSTVIPLDDSQKAIIEIRHLSPEAYEGTITIIPSLTEGIFSEKEIIRISKKFYRRYFYEKHESERIVKKLFEKKLDYSIADKLNNDSNVMCKNEICNKELKQDTKNHRNIHFDPKYFNESVDRFRAKNVEINSVKKGINKVLDNLKNQKVNTNELETKSIVSAAIDEIIKADELKRKRNNIGDLDNN